MPDTITDENNRIYAEDYVFGIIMRTAPRDQIIAILGADAYSDETEQLIRNLYNYIHKTRDKKFVFQLVQRIQQLNPPKADQMLRYIVQAAPAAPPYTDVALQRLLEIGDKDPQGELFDEVVTDFFHSGGPAQGLEGTIEGIDMIKDRYRGFPLVNEVIARYTPPLPRQVYSYDMDQVGA